MDDAQKVTPYSPPNIKKGLEMSKYGKAIVAAIAVLLTGLNVVYGTNSYVQMAIAIATTLGVYVVPNKR